MNIIEIDNLSHRFADGTLGLDGINLNIREGAFVVIAGHNGSGKTTLLRHLNGLLLPTSGTVRLAGIPVEKDLLRSRQFVGMMFQDADSQIVGETVYADVAFGPENLRLERGAIKSRVSNALGAVGLADLADQRPHLLSGGEKRLVSLATVLAMEPEVLLLDEPSTGLDAVTKETLIHVLNSLTLSFVLISHEFDFLSQTARHIYTLQEGRIRFDQELHIHTHQHAHLMGKQPHQHV